MTKKTVLGTIFYAVLVIVASQLYQQSHMPAMKPQIFRIYLPSSVGVYPAHMVTTPVVKSGMEKFAAFPNVEYSLSSFREVAEQSANRTVISFSHEGPEMKFTYWLHDRGVNYQCDQAVHAQDRTFSEVAWKYEAGVFTAEVTPDPLAPFWWYFGLVVAAFVAYWYGLAPEALYRWLDGGREQPQEGA